MNLPNSLTTARILLVPPLVAVLLGSSSPNREILGFIVFSAAVVTDYLDGYLARRRHQVTTMGQLLDPLADKLLISAAFISLVELEIVPAWMVVIIVAREFAVTGLRGIASLQGFAISASKLAKYKMACQAVCVGCLIAANRFPATHPVNLAGRTLLWAAVILAIASMVQYFRQFWSVFDTKLPPEAKPEGQSQPEDQP
jgi:CDP-diacylglycerol--glycerol-3-phosphate 3-phosphatidyltransferase